MAESSGSKSSCAAAAAPLSGRMSPRKIARKNALATAAVGGRDDISNLPDGVLQHMLSFLPAQDAVRTCVLARRWRHMWKSTTGLRLVFGETEIEEFVDHLLRLRLRGGTPLDTCEFRLDDDYGCSISRIILWIRVALQCKVQVLQFICDDSDYQDISPRDGQPLFISQYLKKIELQGVELVPSGLLDLSFCPNLEDLEIVECVVPEVLPISSQSLKRVTIHGYFYQDSRMPISIYAPNLVSLCLEVCDGRTPSLQMIHPSVTACIKICSHDCDRVYSDFDDGYNDRCILLQALSDVQNLVLMSHDTEMFIFRRDLEFCSSFNNLKSLLLDEYWLEPADFSALACLLKLCPVLEKLTLQLDSVGPKHKVEINLSCKPLEISSEISRHLKTIAVKCEVYDERINNVLTFLSKKLNIWFQFGG